MAVLDRVPVDRITARAAKIRLTPLLLSLLALPFVSVGWLAFYALTVIKAVGRACSAGFRWAAAAVMVGFEMAREQHARAG